MQVMQPGQADRGLALADCSSKQQARDWALMELQPGFIWFLQAGEICIRVERRPEQMTQYQSFLARES